MCCDQADLKRSDTLKKELVAFFDRDEVEDEKREVSGKQASQVL